MQNFILICWMQALFINQVFVFLKIFILFLWVQFEGHYYVFYLIRSAIFQKK